MKRMKWIAAAALVMTPVAAMAQAVDWRVLFAVKGAAVFVPATVKGTGNRRRLTTLIVLPAPTNGADIEYNDWVIDCPSLSVEITGGRSFLGTRKVRETAGEGMKATEPRTLDRAIVDYACTGKNESGDSSSFTSDKDAVDYGRRVSQ